MSGVTEHVERARARGAVPYVLDGTAIGTKADLLAAIASALSFPSYFGRNLDALYDCLTDLSWLPEGEHVLIWESPSTLRDAHPADFRAIVDVLLDAHGPHPDGRTFTTVLA